jgi:UDP-glucose-4-epimerase GalE
VKWGPLVEGDVGDTQRVADAMAAHEIMAVMHFAAFSQVGESVGDPQKYYLNNVCGTLSLLKAMLERRCNRLVFSSTGAVYGNAGRDPIKESAAGATVNPYGASKWVIEQILGDYRSAYGMNSFCLRYFNACGAEPSGSIGEFRDPETHLIPRAMMTLQGHVSDFAIFGDDYATPDGTAIRDYIHVVDLAAAHVRALDALLNGSKGGSYNLGTGSGFSVRQVLTAIERETGLKVPLVTKPRRAGDPPILVADPSAADAELGFVPACSDIATIVKSAWAWHQFAHPKKTI